MNNNVPKPKNTKISPTKTAAIVFGVLIGLMAINAVVSLVTSITH